MYKKTLSEYVEERREELNLLLKESKITKEEYDKRQVEITKEVGEAILQTLDDRIVSRGGNSILEETEYVDGSVFENKDFAGLTFHDDTLNVNNFNLAYDIHDDFEALKNLDEFVQYKCVQQLKKLSISPSYFEHSHSYPMLIKDIAPLAKINNLEELFFAEQHVNELEIDYYSSESLPSVKNLKVTNIYDCSFIKNFPNLESLTLEFISFVGDYYKQPKKIDLSFLKNLKTLELFNCPYKATKEDKVDLDDVVDGIGNLENLETLVIYVANGHIEVHGDPFDFNHLTKQKLNRLHKLKNLIIIGGFDLDVGFALEIPNLEKLILDKDNNIINTSLVEGASFKVEYDDGNKYISNVEHDIY